VIPYVLVASYIQNYSVIIEVSSHSNEMSRISGWAHVEVNWLFLKVSRSHGIESFGVLHWDDVALSEMEVEVICLGIEFNFLTLLIGDACLSFDNNVTPGSGWEVEHGLVLIQFVGIDTKFKGISEHDVVNLVQSGVWILWELEEEWFVESTTILAEHRQFSVVISNHVVLIEDGHFHDIEILDIRLIEISECIWLLRHAVPSVVVS